MFVFDNYYTLGELVKTAYSLVATKLFFPGASLIRRPFYMRGKPRVRLGRGFRTGYRCRIETFGSRGDTSAKLVIGRNCHIGDEVHIAAAERVEIGDDCLMASHVFISDCSHGDTLTATSDDHPELRPLVSEPTSIGDNVWIGENVCVLMGARVGSGSIVGANAVVNKKFPDNCILAGAPARIIKCYDPELGRWVRAD
ncbi:DapH/DapD/GlmU-related protein [Thermophilibacter sp.]